MKLIDAIVERLQKASVSALEKAVEKAVKEDTQNLFIELEELFDQTREIRKAIDVMNGLWREVSAYRESGGNGVHEVISAGVDRVEKVLTRD